jgi:hypothetical protein
LEQRCTEMVADGESRETGGANERYNSWSASLDRCSNILCRSPHKISIRIGSKLTIYSDVSAKTLSLHDSTIGAAKSHCLHGYVTNSIIQPPI